MFDKVLRSINNGYATAILQKGCSDVPTYLYCVIRNSDFAILAHIYLGTEVNFAYDYFNRHLDEGFDEDAKNNYIINLNEAEFNNIIFALTNEIDRLEKLHSQESLIKENKDLKTKLLQ